MTRPSRLHIRPLAIVLAGLLLLGPTLALEVGTRLLIDRHRLPVATSSQLLTDIALSNLEHLGKPDVLVVGTSATRDGLQPDVLEDLVREASGRDVRVQGIAQGGMSLEAQRLLVRGLAEDDLLPETVLVGLASGTLSGLLDGSAAADDWFEGSELGLLWRRCDGVAWLELPDCVVGQVSALWRWRGRPDRLASAVLSGMPRTLRVGARTLRSNGWTAERSTTGSRLRAQLPATLDRLPPLEPVPAAVEQGFVDLIDEIRAHGAQVVVFSLPYSPILVDALVAEEPDWVSTMAASHAQLGEAADVRIYDMEAFGAWWDATDSRDLRHLSRTGAEHATRQLWAMPGFSDEILAALDAADPA